MSNTNDSPQLKALLKHQRAIVSVSGKAHALEVAIANCDEKIRVAREGCPSDAHFETLLENVAAAAATGKITSADARKQEQEIAGNRDSVRQQAGEVGKGIEWLDRARKGLQRELGEALLEQKRLLLHEPEVLEAFLLSEAEPVCADYVEAGRVVKTAWLRLRALQSILTRSAQSNVRIIGGRQHQVRLPVVNLPPCEGLDTEIRTAGNMWFDAESMVMMPVINEAEAQELARIRALGVSLGSD